MKKIAFVLMIVVAGVHCGYHLRGTGSALPSHIRVMHVPMFVNRTTRFELDLKLTQKVVDELVSRGKVEITDDSQTADAVLLGEILSFRASPIAFTGEGIADRYSITIVAKVVVRDRAKKKVLFSNPSFIYQGEYEVPEGSDFESVETEAIDEIVERFARSLVVNILEGF
ncbi:MAG: LPS assembly lipoprotein LptE [Candidatus Aminicenantales bacterium]